MISFEVVLEQSPASRGPFIPVPKDVATKLGLRGSPKIQAVIAGVPYRGSLMPMGDGTFGLGVLNSIQTATGVGVGDSITVELGLDTAPRTVAVPADLAKELARDKQAANAWEKLSYTIRKEHAAALEGSKRLETRERRLAATLGFLRSL